MFGLSFESRTVLYLFLFAFLSLIFYIINVLLKKNRILREEIKVRDQALDYVSAYIYIKGLDHTYIFANKPTLELFKVTKEELPGSPDERFFPQAAVEDLFHVDTSVFETGKVSQKEIIVDDGSGAAKIYWETKHPLLDDAGKIVGLVGISTDISNRKKIEEALLESELQLRKLNLAKDKFFAILAHDLRGPIGNFSSGLQYIIEENSDTSAQDKKKILDSLKESSESIFTLLENLLDWSKAQTGNIQFVPENLNLLSIIDEIMDLFSIPIKNKNIYFSVQLPENPMVFADSNMMKVILRNIISNSIKFSYEFGKIEISGKTEGDDFVVEIRDFGIGMSELVLQNLFQIQKVSSNVGTKKEKGSGLGLILCDEYIQINGGRIQVQSELGSGSVFKLFIPKKKD